MFVASFWLGILCTFAAEFVIASLFGLVGYLISKINEGKVAKEALDHIAEAFEERKNDGRIDE